MADQDYAQRLKTGRNEVCPCGSGKKYKKCHLEADEKAQSQALAKTNAELAAKAEKDHDHEGHDHHDHPHEHGHQHQRGGAPKSHAPVHAQKQVNAPRKTGAA